MGQRGVKQLRLMRRREEESIEGLGENEKSFCHSPSTMVRVIVL